MKTVRSAANVPSPWPGRIHEAHSPADRIEQLIAVHVRQHDGGVGRAHGRERGEPARTIVQMRDDAGLTPVAGYEHEVDRRVTVQVPVGDGVRPPDEASIVAP